MSKSELERMTMADLEHDLRERFLPLVRKAARMLPSRRDRLLRVIARRMRFEWSCAIRNM